MEQWKDIPGYEGRYQVSNTGKVFSLLTNKNLATNYRSGKSKKGTTLLPYRYLNLRNEGKSKHHFVHRLVMFAFKGPLPKGMVVMHIDDNPENNMLSNLKYGTQKENQLSCYEKERRRPDIKRLRTIGRRAGIATQKKIEAIDLNGNRRMFNGIREAGRKLNISSAYICNLLKGKIKAKEYEFKYL